MSRWAQWTDDEVVNVWDYQDQEPFHPLTCGGSGGPCHGVKMNVDHQGLRCPQCKRLQDWCHDFIRDGSWRRIVTPNYPLSDRSQLPDQGK